jgi:hypothetical protein
MATLALHVSVGMAGVLLWAGLEKARNLTPTVSTLIRLGIPPKLSSLTAKLLALAEAGVGFGLAFCPQSVCTQIGVMTLGATFASAGLVALRREEPILCNCFGSGLNGRLGHRQVIALVPWLAGTAILHLGVRDSVSLSDGALRLSGLGLGMAAARAVATWRARCEALGDRLSAMEMYLWPY